jgi:RNA polymerase sigma factor (sigma-70 family)
MDPAMPTDDAELLRRYAAGGDEAAFAELVRRYLGLVYHAALRQLGGEAHAAEDVAQRVFTLLARKARTLDGHATLAGWLHTTTRFTANEALRTERRRRAREQEAFTMHHPSNDNRLAATLADSAWADLRPVIDEALGELAAPDREAVLLRYFADLPHARIGVRLAISENAARMRVERALEKLHARLARRGVTSTASALGVVLANQAGAASVALPAGMAASVTSAALAGATATGAAVSAAGIFGFMSTTKITIGVAVLIGAIGVGTGMHGYRTAGRAEAVVAASKQEADAARAQVTQADARAREAEARVRASEARVAALQRGNASAQASSRSVQPSAPVAGGMNPMLSHPEYFRLNGEKYRAELAQKFWPLYRQLNFTPEQIARFEANRTGSYQASTEVVSSAQAKGVSPSDSGVSKLAGEAVLPFETELMAMLGGEAGYREYVRHNRASAGIALVRELAGSLAWSPAPLTAAQGERLAQDLIAETRVVPAAPGSKSVRHVTDWDAVATLARSVLAAEQVPAFQALLDGRKLQERMSELMRTSTATPKPAN